MCLLPSSTKPTIQCVSLNGVLFRRNLSTPHGPESESNQDQGQSGIGSAVPSSAGSSGSLKVPVNSPNESRFPCNSNPYNPEVVDSLLLEVKNDMPLPDMPDPFAKDYKKCFLCRQDIQLDHKNVRLLSQFVSPYTGRIYGRAITGLCIPMQKQVAKYIKRARMSGFMPFIFKDPRYLKDPQPYDPMMKK
ncbi:uncharacterized protein LOC101851593 [Aplysia californica]|uniref:Uncharacterized protein LOC101851593 n=1 Tax=Aplysia californica TaxID=6500 RepID=A0ABM1A687_APLCA|nr:uncharacterized protein LOC101851593 [Aplysia californica]